MWAARPSMKPVSIIQSRTRHQFLKFSDMAKKFDTTERI